VRTTLSCIAVLCAAAICSNSLAQYPTKVIHLVIPFPGGSPSDNFARVITAPLAKELGQPVVIENKELGQWRVR